MTLAVLLTCHERRDTTLACLEALAAQDTDVELVPFVVDAGSTDGTAGAVEAAYPTARVLRQGSELFWSSGMRVAWEAARSAGHRDVLWLNDDTRLDPDAVRRLLQTAEEQRVAATRPVVVGATRDPDDGHLTYGGLHRPDRRRPLAFARVGVRDDAVEVETLNGNAVLVPGEVSGTIGLLDPVFTHAMADIDYGLRARAAGHRVVQAPGTVGTCAANPAPRDASAAEALRRATGTKGLPPREWATFARRWAGPLWPVYALSPYLRRLARAGR